MTTSFNRDVMTRCRRWTAVLLLLCLAPRASSAQTPPKAPLTGFHPTGDYVLVVDGKQVAGAEIYQSDRLPGYLVLSASLSAPVLLSPRTQSVETVQPAKVVRQKGGVVDVLADAPFTPQGKFTFADGVVSFKLDGHEAALRPKPPLLGPQKGADLRAYSAKFADGAEAYLPDQRILAVLRKTPFAVTVRVFFGSWCPHCKRLVPPLLKVEEELKGAKIQFAYFGLPEEGLLNDPEAKRLGVKGVPTGIVYVDSKEVGRIIGNDWGVPEASLRNILKTAGKGKGGPTTMKEGNRR